MIFSGHKLEVSLLPYTVQVFHMSEYHFIYVGGHYLIKRILYWFFVAALDSLDFVIGHPEALTPENGKTFDAAVSALGKICRFHCNDINAPEVICSSHLCSNISVFVFEFDLVGIFIEAKNLQVYLKLKLLLYMYCRLYLNG